MESTDADCLQYRTVPHTKNCSYPMTLLHVHVGKKNLLIITDILNTTLYTNTKKFCMILIRRFPSNLSYKVKEDCLVYRFTKN